MVLREHATLICMIILRKVERILVSMITCLVNRRNSLCYTDIKWQFAWRDLVDSFVRSIFSHIRIAATQIKLTSVHVVSYYDQYSIKMHIIYSP